MYIVNIRNYAYLVPIVEDDQKIFFKTIIPSRKATKQYLIKGKKDSQKIKLPTIAAFINFSNEYLWIKKAVYIGR